MDEKELIETFARMWIECDPNRGGNTGSGWHADDLVPLFVDGVEQTRPRWEWFKPRAEMSIAYLRSRGVLPNAEPPADPRP